MTHDLHITVQGIKGSGKTTLIEWLARTLQQEGHAVQVQYHEAFPPRSTQGMETLKLNPCSLLIKEQEL